MSSMAYYTDGGSMSGSGIDDRDISWSFICQYCEADNDEADAQAAGSSVWAECGKCGELNEGRLDD